LQKYQPDLSFTPNNSGRTKPSEIAHLLQALTLLPQKKDHLKYPNSCAQWQHNHPSPLESPHLQEYYPHCIARSMLVVVTQFWIIPQKSFFFKIKIKKIK
jgi:hypothetical protein